MAVTDLSQPMGYGLLPFNFRAYRRGSSRENHMTTNVGTIDRVLRIVVGAALIAWALGVLPGVAASPWGWIGIVPIATALIGFCPAYTLLGMNTCGKKA